MEHTREARDDDIGRIAALARGALDELSDSKGGPLYLRREGRPEPVERSLTAAIASDEHHVVVGGIDAATVGYAVVRVEVLRDGARLGVVEDLYVEPEARDVGVGEAMMDDVVGWCRSQGCIGLDALALPGERATKNFFERFGLVARAIVVPRSLGDPDP